MCGVYLGSGAVGGVLGERVPVAIDLVPQAHVPGYLLCAGQHGNQPRPPRYIGGRGRGMKKSAYVEVGLDLQLGALPPAAVAPGQRHLGAGCDTTTNPNLVSHMARDGDGEWARGVPKIARERTRRNVTVENLCMLCAWVVCTLSRV